MIRYLTGLLSMVLVIGNVHSPVFAGENPFDPKMPSETGCVDYTVTGGPQGSGTEKFCWRENGAETVTTTKTKGRMMGIVPVAADTRVVTTQKWITTINNEDNTAGKITNPVVYMIDEYNKLSKQEQANFRKNIEELGFNMASTMGGKMQRKAGKMHGYRYDLITVMGTESWVMSDYPQIKLKTKISMGGINGVTEATKIDKDVSPPDSLFIINNKIKIIHNREAEAMSESFARGLVKSMKDPDAAKKMQAQMEQAKEEAARQSAEQNRRRQAPPVSAPDVSPNMEEEERETATEESTSSSIEPSDNEAKSKKDMQKQIEKGLDLFKGLFN